MNVVTVKGSNKWNENVVVDLISERMFSSGGDCGLCCCVCVVAAVYICGRV